MFIKSLRKKFMFKIVLMTTLLLLTSLLLIYFTLIRDFVKQLELEQLNTQHDFFYNIQLDLTEHHKNIMNLITHMHTTQYDGKTVVEIMENPVYKNDLTLSKDYRIDLYLKGIDNNNKSIVDVILINANNGVSFYHSTIPGRSVIADFDFLNTYILPNINEFSRVTQFSPSYSQEFIIGSSDDHLIKATGKLMNITNLNALDHVGYYIITFDPAKFFESEFNKLNDLMGYTLLVQDHTILYNNSPFSESLLWSTLSSNEKTLFLDDIYLFEEYPIQNTKWKLYHIIPKSHLAQSTKKLYYQIFKYVLLIIVIIFILLILISIHYNKRIMKLMGVIQSAEKGQLDIDYIDNNQDEIGQLSQAFGKMCFNLKTYIEKEYLLELEKKNATITALQATINPHFLYNTLDAIRTKSLQHNDYDTSEMIKLLSNIFRWSTHSNEVLVRIEDELDYAMCYLSLQNIRLEHRIQIDCQIDDHLLKYTIPKFTLQPLVENAIQHGFKNLEDEGYLLIKAVCINNSIHFTIRDNGCGISHEEIIELNNRIQKPPRKGDQHHGLKNINYRLRLIYSEANGLSIKSDPEEGTTIIFTVPCQLLKGDDTHVRDFIS